MATVGSETIDSKGRTLTPILGEDSSGNKYVPITNSSGQLEVALVAGTAEVGKLAAGTALIGSVMGVLKEVAEEQDIDGSLGAYAAGDVVGADDCCTTLAVVWEWDVARVAGGYGYITGARLFNETENQAVQYTLKLFNATPTGELRDNYPNDNPLKGDISKWIGDIEFETSKVGLGASAASVATTTEATPSTLGKLPKPFKCAAADTKIYGVLVTNTAYTQTATDAIRITLDIEQY